MGYDIAIPRRLDAMISEYDAKMASVQESADTFKEAGLRLKVSATVGGVFGGENLDVGGVSVRTIETNLRRSAWRHAYQEIGLEAIFPAKDKRIFEQSMADPPPFDFDNLKATFGPYIQDPRGSILRGLAEAFVDLDPAYKSHEKVKIGVKGLPKRVILTNVGGYGWGRDRLRDVLNALAAFQGTPLVEWSDLSAILEDGEALLEDRGIWLKRFQNGNGHLFFGAQALKDINLALAEYYGEVLPDAEPKGPVKRKASTDLARDLQFYATPKAVVDRVLDNHFVKGLRVLEPSCGEGAILDGLREKGASAVGIEVDHTRAQVCRDKGHSVQTANFLETVPTADFDKVVMNPPFYGTHYEKHVRHALKFLKPGGELIAILPATARYDHGLLDDLHPTWCDLGVGAFSESGTNICTSVAVIHKGKCHA